MISIIAFILVILGCMNWLCIGFFQYDLVAGLFGYQGSIFSRIVYIVVGISAIWLTYAMIKNKGRLSMKKALKEENFKVQNQRGESVGINQNTEENYRNGQYNNQKNYSNENYQNGHPDENVGRNHTGNQQNQ